MCIAIAAAAGLVLDRDVLKNCFDNNSDGCGMAYIKDDAIQIYKSMNFEPFYEEYVRVQGENSDSPFLLHFRIKTHGLKDIDNCHPFQVDDNVVFIHNGIIRNVPDCPDKKRSDTQMFNECILKGLPDGWNYNNSILDLIEEYIGMGSKLAVLDKRTRDIIIINESKGTWDNGVWFSNTSYKTKAISYYGGYYKKPHAVNCKNCNANIQNSIYANNTGWDFCCFLCKEKYEDKNPIVEKPWVCADCGGVAKYYMQGQYFCSVTCELNYDKVTVEIADKKDKQEDIAAGILHECQWCGDYYEIGEMFDVDLYNIGKSDRCCYSCVEHVADAGWIELTPELIHKIDLIKLTNMQAANA